MAFSLVGTHTFTPNDTKVLIGSVSLNEGDDTIWVRITQNQPTGSWPWSYGILGWQSSFGYEQLYAVTNNWYLEGESLEEGSVLTTRYKVEMQEGIKFAGGKAGITRDGELYFTSNGGKYVIAVNDEQIGLTRIDSAY